MPFAGRNCTITMQSSALAAYAIDTNLMLTMSLHQHSALPHQITKAACVALVSYFDVHLRRVVVYSRKAEYDTYSLAIKDKRLVKKYWDMYSHSHKLTQKIVWTGTHRLALIASSAIVVT